MALDNPVFLLSSRRPWRNARAVELVVVVGLTVAVVAVAALWDGTSSTTEPEAVSRVETITADPPAPAVATSEPAGAVETVEVNLELTEAEAGVQVAAVEVTAQEHVVPSQTGIVPGRPDPPDPAFPDSFERYQVQRGESLFSIASALGVSVEDLLLWNRHLDGDSTLVRGEWIWIPQWDLPIVAEEDGSLTEEGKRGRGGG